MSSHDDILRMFREADRILAPLRDFERIYGHGFQQLAEELQKSERLLQTLPDLSISYTSAIESFQLAVDCFRDFEHHSPAIALLADAHESFAALVTKHAGLESISMASNALGHYWEGMIFPR